MYNSNHFELNALRTRVESIQELGADCYLQLPDAANAVHVRVGDSAEAAIREALGDSDDISLLEVYMTESELSAGIISSGAIINGHGGFAEEDFQSFNETHSPESLSSHQELVLLLEENFGSGSDWRVWETYCKSLPPLSENALERVFVPLLEAGELGSGGVPRMIDELLLRNGWSSIRIEASYSAEERRVRSNRQAFLEEAGVPPSNIQSANDLIDAIFPTLAEWGGSSSCKLVEHFILGHRQGDDSEQLRQIVAPFMSEFGMSGNTELNNALMEFDWYSPESWTRYDGEFTWYGDW